MSLILSSSFMSKDLFYKSFFTIKYTLGNKIIAITLANTYAIGYDFLDKKFLKTICQVLEIKPER